MWHGHGRIYQTPGWPSFHARHEAD
jgi:hypothetical protein